MDKIKAENIYLKETLRLFWEALILVSKEGTKYLPVIMPELKRRIDELE